MADNEKVYTPDWSLPDQPFPGKEEEDLSASQKTSSGVYSPQKLTDNPLPVRKTAHELIGSALNTKSRKILAEFQFTEMGAISIGRYVPGVSGDIRHSPNGIVARNQAGLITFALDGTTGNAVFRGTVQAGSIISESELIGGSININDRFTVDSDGNVVITEGNITIRDEAETTIIDSTGLVSTANFPTGFYGADGLIGTAAAEVDVAGSTLNFTLSRNTRVLLMATVTIAINTPNIGDYMRAFMEIDNIATGPVIVKTPITINTTRYTTHTTHMVRTLAAGPHTLNLAWGTDSGTAFMTTRGLTYLIMGT